MMYSFSKADAKRVAWTAAQAFVAAFAVTISQSQARDWNSVKTVGLAAATAGVAAAFSAVKNFVLADGSAAK